MLVYQSTKREFIDDVNLNKVTDKILGSFKETFHHSTSVSEIRSWEESTLRMRGVLDDNEIPDNAGIAIEFNIPHTSNRIDFLITGYDKENKTNVIIIELKQWQRVNKVDGKDGIVRTYTGGREQEVSHPSYQAWSYSTLIENFNQEVYDNNVELYPCAFLHNYKINNDDPICDESYKDYIDRAPLFGSRDFEKLRDFIKKYISKGDDKKGLYLIENGKIRPSKMLQDAFASTLKGNKEFILIDKQKVVYEEALSAGVYANNHNQKTVMIVEGGPGTGKSVLAINLLKEYLNKGLTAFYVTKNAAPRYVYETKLKINKLSKLDVLFKSSDCFCESNSNDFNVLIIDEAHRLREKSGIYGNKGENQIKEIINASTFSLFFIDDNQKVTLQDIGSVAEIEKHATNANAKIIKTELVSQFRCDGSDGYLAWLDNLLDIRDTANFDYDISYEFKVFDDPNELRKAIIEKNKNNKSRIVAGYCWDWNTKKDNNPDLYDIEIPEYDFKMRWNFNKTKTWAIDKNSINEVGCIHTSQGLEFDYVGVIIGDDLRFENGRIITDYTQRAKTDYSLRGIKTIAKKQGKEYAHEISDKIIKNTYKTLMTRGLKGCYVYCTNKALASYLKSYLKD